MRGERSLQAYHQPRLDTEILPLACAIELLAFSLREFEQEETEKTEEDGRRIKANELICEGFPLFPLLSAFELFRLLRVLRCSLLPYGPFRACWPFFAFYI